MGSKKLSQRMTFLRNLIFEHSHFFLVVQTDTRPQNFEIRMKTKIVPYPENQVEFIHKVVINYTVYIDGPL